MKTLKTLIKASLLTATIGAFSVSAHANLIVNGGFEQPNFNGTTWTWTPSTNVDGWDGSNIELWKSGFNGVASFDGSNQHAELNAHPYSGQPFNIFQTFSTTVGQSYDVTFAYRARANNSEEFNFGIDGLISEYINDHTTAGWSVYSTSFIANDTNATIRFTSVNPLTQTVGNFIDDVSVVSSPTQVAEPATLALLGLGLAGLGFSRRRMKNA